MMRIAAILFVFGGCGPDVEWVPNPGVVCAVLDPSAEKYAAPVAQVTNAFNDQRPGLFNCSVPDARVILVVSTMEGWKEGNCAARYNPGVISLCDTLRPAWDHLPITLTHEFGHAFGLGHSPLFSNIMYKSTTAVAHTLEESITQVLEHFYP